MARGAAGGCPIAHALAAGTNSIPTTAALKVVVTARCVTFMMLPLSLGEIFLPDLHARNERENRNAEPIFFSHY
jgi:hypothetical protein